jgi:hypothetical protein
MIDRRQGTSFHTNRYNNIIPFLLLYITVYKKNKSPHTNTSGKLAESVSQSVHNRSSRLELFPENAVERLTIFGEFLDAFVELVKGH